MPKRKKRPAVPKTGSTASEMLQTPVPAGTKRKMIAIGGDMTLAEMVRVALASYWEMPDVLTVARPGNFTATDKPRSRD